MRGPPPWRAKAPRAPPRPYLGGCLVRVRRLLCGCFLRVGFVFALGRGGVRGPRPGGRRVPAPRPARTFLVAVSGFGVCCVVVFSVCRACLVVCGCLLWSLRGRSAAWCVWSPAPPPAVCGPPRPPAGRALFPPRGVAAPPLVGGRAAPFFRRCGGAACVVGPLRGVPPWRVSFRAPSRPPPLESAVYSVVVSFVVVVCRGRCSPALGAVWVASAVSAGPHGTTPLFPAPLATGARILRAARGSWPPLFVGSFVVVVVFVLRLSRRHPRVPLWWRGSSAFRAAILAFRCGGDFVMVFVVVFKFQSFCRLCSVVALGARVR